MDAQAHAHELAKERAITHACHVAFVEGNNWAYVADVAEVEYKGGVARGYKMDIQHSYYTSAQPFDRAGFTRYPAKEDL